MFALMPLRCTLALLRGSAVQCLIFLVLFALARGGFGGAMSLWWQNCKLLLLLWRAKTIFAQNNIMQSASAWWRLLAEGRNHSEYLRFLVQVE